MKFIISGKNIEITQGLRSAVETKIGKLEKYFTKETEVHVTLSVEKDRQKIEVTIPVKGGIIRSEQIFSRHFWKRIFRRRKRYGSSAPRDLTSSRCIRRMPVCRWSFWATAFSYFSMPRPSR